jgi:hypothetical protein
MNQVQSKTIAGRPLRPWWSRRSDEHKPPSLRSAGFPGSQSMHRPNSPRRRTMGFGILISVFMAVVRTVWFIITLPIRLVFWIVALLGRVVGVVLGFMLMVFGIALWAGPFFLIGIPLFLIGLVLTLRCLE